MFVYAGMLLCTRICCCVLCICVHCYTGVDGVYVYTAVCVYIWTLLRVVHLYFLSCVPALILLCTLCNRCSGDCGLVAIKFIELHALGDLHPRMNGMTDDLVDIMRKQFTMDLYKDWLYHFM